MSRHRFTAETARAHGAKGGQTTAARHGREHMSAIGRRGYQAAEARLADVLYPLANPGIWPAAEQVQDGTAWLWKRVKRHYRTR